MSKDQTLFRDLASNPRFTSTFSPLLGMYLPADWKKKDSENNSILHAFTENFEQDLLGMIDLLIAVVIYPVSSCNCQKGCRVNQVNYRGWTALHVAVSSNHFRIVQKLIGSISLSLFY